MYTIEQPAAPKNGQMGGASQKHIRLLDCTLRDGGHINQGEFGEIVIKNVLRCLVEARIDIIELGFLWDKPYGTDTARYYTIADVKRVLPPNKGKSEFSLMADFIDLEHLEPCDGTVKYIRLSFKRHRLDWGLKTARNLMDKGYQCFINPVNCNVYTDEEYLEVIKKVNELKPYAFSIVDTFGVMRLRDLSHAYYLVENNLDPEITIGLHLHENLGLAYSLAQHYLSIVDPKRKIVIDGSLLGMGRDPGNLCIEQIMDYMNSEYGCDYYLAPAYDAIDDHIAPIKQNFQWGYNIPYALSAKYRLHRTYAEYLMGKWKIRTSDIERILRMVDRSEAEMFNESYIEKLYRDYMSVPCDDDVGRKKLRDEIGSRPVLVVAPGRSIAQEKQKIVDYICRYSPYVLTVHCKPEGIQVDREFYTTIKRLDQFGLCMEQSPLLVTSNLTRYNITEKSESYIIRYDRLAYHDGIFCDDSVMMLLNLFLQIGIFEVTVAGFDGFITDKNQNFYIENLSRDVDMQRTADVKELLKQKYQQVKINFLTSSYYEDYRN